MKRDNSKFQGGSKFGRAGSTYECACCGMRTRETGHDESSLELCAYCYEEAGWENTLSDGGCTQAEFDAAIADLKVQYKRDDAQPTKAEPAKVQPTKAEPAKVQPNSESAAVAKAFRLLRRAAYRLDKAGVHKAEADAIRALMAKLS